MNHNSHEAITEPIFLPQPQEQSPVIERRFTAPIGMDDGKTVIIELNTPTVPLSISTNEVRRVPGAIDMRQRDDELLRRYPEPRAVSAEDISQNALANNVRHRSPQDRIANIDRNNPYAHLQDRRDEAMRVARPLPPHLQRRP